jgi:hypothetical protein
MRPPPRRYPRATPRPSKDHSTLVIGVISCCCLSVLCLGVSGHVQNVAEANKRAEERKELSDRNNAYNEALHERLRLRKR